MRLAAALLLPALLGAQRLATVEGRIIRTASGNGLADTELTLRLSNAAGGPRSYVSATDDAGRFRIAAIEPGEYTVEAARRGYTRTLTQITLVAGQTLSAFDLRMTPLAVIAGRVTDIESDPLEAIVVDLLRYTYTAGRRELTPYATRLTNDLGEYRITAPPGRYYLRAHEFSAPIAGNIHVPAGDPGQAFLPTYYPATAESAAASPIDVAAGSVVEGADIALQQARAVSLRGRIAAPARTDPSAVRALLISDLGGQQGTYSVAAPDAEGAFEITGVAPGNYQLFGFVATGSKSYSARQPVSVGMQDVEGLLLSLEPAARLDGTVRAEGPVNLAALSIRLEAGLSMRATAGSIGALRWVATPKQARVDSNGAFTFGDTVPDRYTLTVAGLGGDGFVKAAHFGREDVLLNGLNFRGDAALDIVVSANGARLEGKVDAAPGTTVVLVPEAADRYYLYRTAETGREGNYSIRGIAPGSYTAYAFDNAEPGAWTDPEFLKTFEKGRSITFAESATETADLVLAKPILTAAPEK